MEDNRVESECEDVWMPESNANEIGNRNGGDGDDGSRDTLDNKWRRGGYRKHYDGNDRRGGRGGFRNGYGDRRGGYVNRKPHHSPRAGGKIMEIEFDAGLLSELHDIAEAENVGSLYQVIRNACYDYVKAKREQYGNGQNNDASGEEEDA